MAALRSSADSFQEHAVELMRFFFEPKADGF
jgi:hypothetical protein